MVRMTHLLPLSVLLAAALAAGCDNAESQRMEQTRARLAGTWLREVDAEGTKSRRVLVLGADAKFTDRVSVLVAGKQAERAEFAGEWSYDGINLKRRFLQENGRQYAGGGMRYATFPSSRSRNPNWSWTTTLRDAASRISECRKERSRENPFAK